MNKDNAAQFLPLVQALAEGKTLQFKPEHGKWYDLAAPVFNSAPEQYRIKPEPKFTARYKRYVYSPYKAGVTSSPSTPYEVHILNEFDGYNVISPVEKGRGFISWIDTEWQQHQLPET